MFFITYLARELRRRMRQAVFIALGLAVGVGLVLTVTAASAGVKNAQASVLKGLDGVATDITVTGPAPQPPKGGPAGPGSHGTGDGNSIQLGPGGAQMCVNGKCHPLKDGYTIDNLGSGSYSPVSHTAVGKIAARRDVAAAAGGLLLTDNQTTISSNPSPPTSFSVDGTDLAHQGLGPLSNATLAEGSSFTSADSGKDVALVDKSYATANNLKVGRTIKVGGTACKIIGLVTQPEASSPPNVYLPLATAQALAAKSASDSSLKSDVNTIYVTATSGADLTAIAREITKILPTATVTTPSSLASQISGSMNNAAKLANDLGRWLSVLVLIAAFAMAVLLTMAAVTRRVREFGTLKALGWRGRRIIAQVMGESLAVGALGAAAGVGLGFAGAAIINAIAPRLSAVISQATGQHIVTPGGSYSPTTTHAVSVPLAAVLSGTAIGVAVLLALGGGLIAGGFASWRIGRMRPADAIAKVG